MRPESASCHPFQPPEQGSIVGKKSEQAKSLLPQESIIQHAATVGLWGCGGMSIAVAITAAVALIAASIASRKLKWLPRLFRLLDRSDAPSSQETPEHDAEHRVVRSENGSTK